MSKSKQLTYIPQRVFDLANERNLVTAVVPGNWEGLREFLPGDYFPMIIVKDQDYLDALIQSTVSETELEKVLDDKQVKTSLANFLVKSMRYVPLSDVSEKEWDYCYMTFDWALDWRGKSPRSEGPNPSTLVCVIQLSPRKLELDDLNISYGREFYEGR